MRRRERIPIVLEKISWFNFIQNNTGMSKLSDDLAKIVENIKKNRDKIEQLWLEYPDLRLGQLLINEGLAPDVGRLWNVEEDDWLVDEDYCNLEDIKFWGRMFDKDMNRLPRVEWILLRELTTDHIKGILKFFGDQGRQVNNDYRDYFIKRLENEGTLR